ncbi:hypothetical protein ABIC78_002609 [Novosphingobium sp. 1529]|uniref:hypothetical protein n=1 Tax=Novosphingobium sp. 1529 TaxID=3156424 RepID=UPI00339A6275
MGIRIAAKAGHRLQVSGDVETVLDIPAHGVAKGFSLAFSEGTLVLGRWIPGGNACRFGIANEGTAMTRITRHGLGEAVDLDGKFDWIRLAFGAQTLQPDVSAEGDGVLQLTLDIDVRTGV